MDIENRKKPLPDFVIRLDALGLRPWDVPMRHLARVMDAVQRLVEQREEDEPAPALVKVPGAKAPIVDRALRLIDIKKGSAVYPVASPKPEPALRLIRDTGADIDKPDEAKWTQPTLSAIKELSEVANSLGCVIEIRAPGPKGKVYGDILATIRPGTYDSVSQAAFITGDTTVHATIERVGGATEMHCGIRVPSQDRKMVICRVDGEQLVRQLGQYIYQEVSLVGKATWLRHNFELRSMVIRAIEPPKVGSFRESLKRIHAAGGDSWDDIPDPDAALAEFRGA